VSPTPPETEVLSDPKMWERMYGMDAEERFWPFPDKRCSAFELDRLYRAHLPRTPGTRILEMGCGGSKWLPYFHKTFGYEVAGVDYTEIGCAHAVRNLERAGGRGTIVCKDFNELGEEFRSAYDVVMSLGVVEHFAHPETVLRTFAGCLREGGWMITYIPNLNGVMGALLKRIDRRLYDTHHVFDLEALRGFHRKAGLEVVASTYLELADFSLLPLERYPDLAQKVLKTSIYGLNRLKLALYRATGWNVQSRTWCAAMIVLARRPAASGTGGSAPATG
jgi:SAM-dependent methyltransferase